MAFLKRYYRITTLFLIGIFLTYLSYIQDSGFNISPKSIYCETSDFITRSVFSKTKSEKISLELKEEAEPKPCPESTI